MPKDAISHFELSENYHSQPIAGVFWLCLNTGQFPLNSSKIRKALSLAINRTSLAQNMMRSETPTDRLLSGDRINHMDEIDQSIQAKSLFKEGLKELHLTQTEFPILIFSHSSIEGHRKIAEVLQQRWKEILGIKVNLQQAEWSVFFANLGQRQYEIGGCSWYAAFNDPIYFFEFFKDKTNRYNAPQWENIHYQKLLELADSETNPAIRKEHIKQAEMLLLEEAPIIPLYINSATFLTSPSIRGLPVSDLGLVDFKWAYIQ